MRNQGPSDITLQNARIIDQDPGSAAFFSLTGPTTGTIASGAAATWGIACSSSKVRTATFELLHDVPGAGSYRTTVRCGQLASEPLPEPPGFPPNPPSEPM
jgi:hypothetical protein